MTIIYGQNYYNRSLGKSKKDGEEYQEYHGYQGYQGEEINKNIALDTLGTLDTLGLFPYCYGAGVALEGGTVTDGGPWISAGGLRSGSCA